MLWLSPFYYIEAKFWPLKKRVKHYRHHSRWNFSEEQPVTPLFDHKWMKKFWKSLTVEPADKKLRRYKSDWLWHVTRTNSNRMLKIMLNCRLNGRRWLGRPLNRLLGKAITGLSRPNSWQMMIYIRAFSIIKTHNINTMFR